MQAQNRRPGHDVEAEELGYGDTLNGPIDRVLDDQDSQVDTGGQPSELQSDQRDSITLSNIGLTLEFFSSPGTSARMPMIEAKDIVPLSSA